MYDTNLFGVHIIRSFRVHMIRIYPTTLILPTGPSGGTMTSEPGRVIRVTMGFYNVFFFFLFMSKIKPVVNITLRYFYVLFYDVNYTHSQPKRSYLVSYLIKNMRFQK